MININKENLYIDWDDFLEEKWVITFDDAKELYKGLELIEEWATTVVPSAGEHRNSFYDQKMHRFYACCYHLHAPFNICYDDEKEVIRILPEEIRRLNHDRFVRIAERDFQKLREAEEFLHEATRAHGEDIMIAAGQKRTIQYLKKSTGEWDTVLGMPTWGSNEKYRVKAINYDAVQMKIEELIEEVGDSKVGDELQNALRAVKEMRND